MSPLVLQFNSAAKSVVLIEQLRQIGKISAVDAGYERGKFLALALDALAHICQVNDLQKPLFIDSRGEFSVVSKVGFTQFFCDLLNPHRPRTGIYPGATMEPGNGGWCYMNHFDVEKMIMEYYGSTEIKGSLL